jgi:FkbM family methyltransferase
VSRTVADILSGIVTLGSAYARPWRRASLRLLVAERLHQRHCVATRYGPLAFVSTDAHALEAPREFHSREPQTLEWIDGFQPGDVLWDIGANLGIYALYAGKRGDIDVLAFEPSPASYAALCANVAENRIDRVRAYCIALGERTGLGVLNMSETYPGSVYNAFEQRIDMMGRELSIARRQAGVGISADDLIEHFGAPAPNHIKLDVDSTEIAILRGAARLLQQPALTSLLVENAAVETAQNREIDAILTAAGFQIEMRGHGGGLETVNVIYRR